MPIVQLIAHGGLIALVVWLAPTAVGSTAALIIEAASKRLHNNPGLQSRLKDGSAWPGETGSPCSCEHQGGEAGARTGFLSKGRHFGCPDLLRRVDGPSVVLALFRKGPPQRTLPRFELVPLGASRTGLRLNFGNTLPRPFIAIQRLAGIVRWTRNLPV